MIGYSFLRFSADGTAIIVQSNNVLSWLDVKTGATIRRLPQGWVRQLSADDKTFIALGSDQQVLIGDAVTGKIKHKLPIAAMFSEMEHGVLFLPDGVTLAAVHHFDPSTKEIQLWDITTGKRRETTWPVQKTDGRKTYRLAHSPDGKVLYFSQWGFETRRYALATGKELAPIPITSGEVFPHPDGKTLISGGSRWDISTGKEISKDKDFINWSETAFSSDGRWLAMRGTQYHKGFLELCDTESKDIKRIPWTWGNGSHLAFTADSRSLIVNDYYHLQFLSVPKLAKSKKLVPAGKYDIESAALHLCADGRHLAVVRSTGLLRLFDLTTDKQVWSMDRTHRALFNPNGKSLLIQSGKLRLFDLETKKILFSVDPPNDRAGRRGDWISDWAFDPACRILAVAMSGGHIMLLDATTGIERTRFLSVPLRRVGGLDGLYLHTTALAFSPDGQWLAGGGDDGYLRIWEVSTRRELHRLHGHEGATQALGFSADGRRLVSFGDGEGLLWDLRPRKENMKESDPFADLLSKDGPTVYRALWTMANDPEAPAMLREKFPPKHLDARPERITLLIADLGAEQFKTRNAAMRALAELEGIARPALVGALQKNPSLELKRRIEKLLAELETPTEPALQISRAVKAMEFNQSEAARKLLQDWSEGTPGLRLTEDSRAVRARCAGKR
jgi:WD40 repeat protein